MKIIKLGEVVEITQGYPFDSSLFAKNGALPVIRIRDVVPGRSSTYLNGMCDKRYLVNKGEILIGMDGEFNRARWQSQTAALNQRVCRVRALKNQIDEDYLFYLLPQELKKIEERTPFVTVKHLSVKQINDTRVRLPPLPEQRRIAAILDQADALRAKRREALAKLDEMAQAIFVEMFGDPLTDQIAKNRKEVYFRDVSRRITYGFTSPMSHHETGIAIITAKNVLDGMIDLDHVHYAKQSEFDALTDKSKPRSGDILITKDGTIGRCAIFEGGAPICINQSVALVRLDLQKVQSSYVMTYLLTPSVKAKMKGMKKGNALQHLQITELAKFPILLPPYEEQTTFACRRKAVVEERMRIVQSARELDTLFASLQHRAFNGTL